MFLYRAARADDANVWIGLYNEEGATRSDDTAIRRRNWQWADGSLYSTTGWSGWEISEPGFSEKWVRIRSGKWLAIDNELDANYCICQKGG